MSRAFAAVSFVKGRLGRLVQEIKRLILLNALMPARLCHSGGVKFLPFSLF